MLEIVLVSDTGLPLANPVPPDASTFQPAENCSSTITLVAWYCQRGSRMNWYSDIWRTGQRPNHDGQVIDHPKQPVSVVSKSFDIATLGNLDAVNAMTDDFKHILSSCFGLNFKKGQ